MADTKDTYRTVTPYLLVPDADSMLAFLKQAFDATEVQCHRNPDGTIGHAELKIGDSLVMLGQAGGQFKAREGAFYLWVDDVDATYRRALDAGAASESLPEDKPYGHRNAGVVDPAGITWWIAAPVK
jgi:PhnB protein